MKKTVLTIIIALLMLFAFGCTGSRSQNDGTHPFDYYIDCTTKDDIENLSKESFVEGVFPFTLMIFQRPGYNNPMQGQIAFLAAPSFDNMEFSPFDRKSMKEEDPEIMRDPGKNPIIIDEATAKAEKLSVGDTLYQKTGISEEPMSFTVAGIYRHTQLFAQFEAVVLINDQIEKLFADRVDELGYTNGYVKASDPAALKTFFENDFIPHLTFNGLSEEEIKAIPAEELKVYYEDYETHMKRMN